MNHQFFHDRKDIFLIILTSQTTSQAILQGLHRPCKSVGEINSEKDPHPFWLSNETIDDKQYICKLWQYKKHLYFIEKKI